MAVNIKFWCCVCIFCLFVMTRLDLIENGNLDLSDVQFFVLDEADNLVENHCDALTKMYQKLPKSKLQALLFSATLHSPEVRAAAEKFTKFPTWVDLKGKDSVPETVHHGFVYADPAKEDLLKLSSGTLRIETDGIHRRDNLRPSQSTPEAFSEGIKILKPHLLLKIIDSYKMDQALIFVRTKLDADHLENFLRDAGGNKKGALESEYSCVALHGDRSVPERKENLRKFREGEVRFLICTDVAARGIDIKELPFVINIQNRLKQEVPHLQADYKLPTSVGNVIYGQFRQQSSQSSEVHMEQLKDQVKELGQLEDAAQKKFWTIKTLGIHKFGRHASIKL